MGVFNYEEEHTSTIPPAKLFKAFILDADNLFPKVAPQAVKGSEIVEGNGGVGTIKKITFGEGSALGYVKHKIDGIDEANFCYSYSIIEGDALGDTIEKISYEIKLVVGPDGGSIVKNKSNYYTKGDHQVDEAKIKEGKVKAHQLFKLVESYLKDHPDLYN